MFEPENLPPPDENGFFLHPDVPGEEEGDDVRAMFREMGYDAASVSFEFDAPVDLRDAYYEIGDETAVARWTPTPPGGAGWVLVGKCDTEDGPSAIFTRRLQ